MKIRSKLAWTYVIILIIGIFTISSYAILASQSYLLDEGEADFQKDTQILAQNTSNLDERLFIQKLEELSVLSGYEIAAYDSTGVRLAAFPDSAFTRAENNVSKTFIQSFNDQNLMVIDERDEEKLISYAHLENTKNPIHYIRISKIKDEYFAAIASIRHIIYAGMLFSTIAVVIISFMFARYISAPILYLNEAALDIAKGNTDRNINIRRSDEFGTLSNSLNQMATTLREDNQQLKRLNEQQQQFFADITHEVRNPLHTIAGSLEMLEIQDLPADKKDKYLVTARKQTLRIGRLFEDLKTLQRYDLDDSFLNKKEADLKVIAQDISETYQALAEEKDIQLLVECEGKTTCMIDVNKIEQVMDNLVSNAIKYSNGGQITIAIQKTGNQIQVSISDEGIGIDKEHLERLFDRFYRTDKARSRDKGGTGLGLAVVKSILNAHGSDIHVESTLGKGSTFYFELEGLG